jgi:hypothetical protein
MSLLMHSGWPSSLSRDSLGPTEADRRHKLLVGCDGGRARRGAKEDHSSKRPSQTGCGIGPECSRTRAPPRRVQLGPPVGGTENVGLDAVASHTARKTQRSPEPQLAVFSFFSASAEGRGACLLHLPQPRGPASCVASLDKQRRPLVRHSAVIEPSLSGILPSPLPVQRGDGSAPPRSFERGCAARCDRPGTPIEQTRAGRWSGHARSYRDRWDSAARRIELLVARLSA